MTYFVLTFLISWGGILVVLGPGAFMGAARPTEGLLPVVFLAMFAGPSVARILMTGVVVIAVLLPLSLSSARFLRGVFASGDRVTQERG